MKTERSGDLEADVTARIQDIERHIRLLHTLRHQAHLEATTHQQLARIAALQSDVRAMRSCGRFRELRNF